MKIEDEALSGVNGGVVANTQNNNDDIREKDCPRCKEKTKFKLYTGGRAVCQKCGYQINNA